MDKGLFITLEGVVRRSQNSIVEIEIVIVDPIDKLDWISLSGIKRFASSVVRVMVCPAAAAAAVRIFPSPPWASEEEGSCRTGSKPCEGRGNGT